jgi:hypothetical protein
MSTVIADVGYQEFWKAFQWALCWTANDDSEDGGELFGGGGIFKHNHPDAIEECFGLLSDQETAELADMCIRFWDEAHHLFDGRDSDAGYFFLMTAQGQGSCFSDGRWPEHGDELDGICKKYSNVSLMGHRDENGILTECFLCH